LIVVFIKNVLGPPHTHGYYQRKTQKRTCVGNDEKKLEPLCTVTVNVKGMDATEKLP
jgi:hypothetical protein